MGYKQALDVEKETHQKQVRYTRTRKRGIDDSKDRIKKMKFSKKKAK